jgi:hypothetical protein
MKKHRLILLSLCAATVVGCGDEPPSENLKPNLSPGMVEVSRMPATLGLTADEYPLSEGSGMTQHLALKLPLPLIASPQTASDCPMLDETIQFSLGGQPPYAVSRGGSELTTHDFGPDTRECASAASVTFIVPIEGGRLPLRAWSSDGEAGMVVNIPPAYQPTIVSPRSAYAPGNQVRLELPSDLYRDLGIDSPIGLVFSAVLVDETGNWAVSTEGLTGETPVATDSTGLTVTLRENTTLQTDQLYVMYDGNFDMVLSLEDCAGFKSCSGSIRGLQLLAPVTIKVGFE